LARCLGLDDGDNTSDETTIWRFREASVRADDVDALFARFDAHLKSLGYLAMGTDRGRQHHRGTASAHDR
jgi:IS5 family transposase